MFVDTNADGGADWTCHNILTNWTRASIDAVEAVMHSPEPGIAAKEQIDMVHGTVSLSQLSDKALILVVQARDNNPGLLLTQGQIGGGSGAANASLVWQDQKGLKAVSELLHTLADLP